jgi:hypothetical protein
MLGGNVNMSIKSKLFEDLPVVTFVSVVFLIQCFIAMSAGSQTGTITMILMFAVLDIVVVGIARMAANEV